MIFLYLLRRLEKKFFAFNCSHCSPSYFSFYIIMIDGDQLVKSEQSTLHLSASLAGFRRLSRQYDGDEGEAKSFFGENCSHCSLSVFVIYFHGVSM